MARLSAQTPQSTSSQLQPLPVILALRYRMLVMSESWILWTYEAHGLRTVTVVLRF
jgi:hypothetical protein